MTEGTRALEGSLVLGRYRIVKPLARGGMGMVYLGRVEGAAGFAKPVVIKRILAEAEEADESAHASFIREARLLSELQHPGIVGVLDFGLEQDTYLMVLEYVHGYHVGHWLKYVRATRGELEWEFAVYVMLRVLSALHYAHRHASSDGQVREVIHRDISPGNILIDFGGNVRLVDFGIARAKGHTGEYQTQDGIVKGKLPYIAPEVFRSDEASVVSDVYAAGVVLYQLLAGINPFSDKDMSKIVRRVLEDVPVPICARRNDVPRGVDVALARALAKNPAGRFQTASEFMGALQALLPQAEGELAERFRAAIAEDFSGQLPQVLRIESLSSLDAAWRASAPDPTQEPSLKSSIPPPAGDDQTRLVSTGTGTSGDEQKAARTSAATPRLLLVLFAGLAAAAALGVLIVVVLSGRGADKQEARFLLVERPTAPASVADDSASAADAPDPASSEDSEATSPEGDSASALAAASAPVAEASTTAKPAGLRPPSGAQALTEAFSKRQGAVQSCFSSNASALQGSPQVTIRFQVDASGAVQSVALSPSELSGTGLGQCLLGVARATRFPAQGQPVMFSIPITARVVDRR